MGKEGGLDGIEKVPGKIFGWGVWSRVRRVGKKHIKKQICKNGQPLIDAHHRCRTESKLLTGPGPTTRPLPASSFITFWHPRSPCRCSPCSLSIVVEAPWNLRLNFCETKLFIQICQKMCLEGARLNFFSLETKLFPGFL